jgi:tetratricopeptide (TPR) repeat protein
MGQPQIRDHARFRAGFRRPRRNKLFFFVTERHNPPDMRHLFGILSIIMAGAAFGADVRDLGVPAGWSASDYDRRGYELLNKHDYENARRYFDAAIRTDPSMWTAYYNRAVTFCQQKKWAAALQDLNSTIRLKPSFFDATYKRSLVHRKLSNYKGSLADLDMLIVLSSKVHNTLEAEQALNNRAWILATSPEPSVRNGQLAVADAMKACKLNGWTLGSSIDTVAAAYAETGDFDSAVRYQQQAINVLTGNFQLTTKWLSKRKDLEHLTDKTGKDFEAMLQGFKQRLELYKQHRPFRDTRE